MIARMTRAALAAVAMLCATQALAQGTLAPGHVLGNGTAVTRTPTDATITTVLDQGACLTNDRLLARITGAWACGTLTAPLSLSAGALSITGAAGQVPNGATAAFTATPTLGAAGTLGSLTFGNATSGLLTLQTVTGALGAVTVSLPAATDTLVGKATTDILTNKTFDTAGTGNVFKINGNQITSNTGTGAVNVLATSPVLVTPNIGVATATTINGNTITTGIGTLTLGAGKTLTANASTTLAGTDGKTLTVSNSVTLAGGDGSTLAIVAGKTLTASNSLTLAGSDGTTLTFQGNGTVVNRDSTDTFTNKTFDTAGTGNAFRINGTAITAVTGTGSTAVLSAAPTIAGGAISALTGLAIRSTGAAFDLTFANTEVLTAGRTLTFTVNNAARNLNLSGDLTTAAAFSTAGGFGMTLTATGLTNVTLPTGGTLVNSTVTTLSSLSSVGTITTGVWNATVVGATYGGTGINNGSNTITLGGNINTAGALTTSGAFGLTLTATNTTNSTLPAGTHTLAGLDVAQTFTALNGFTSIQLSSGLIYPTVDSTTALRIMKADGVTRVVSFDTTNARVGINKTPGAFDLDVNGAVNLGGILTFGTLSATSLAASTSTITGLTVNNSPSSSNDYLPYYDSVNGRVSKATIGSIAAASSGGVQNINGLCSGTGCSIVTSGASNVASSGTTVTVATPDYFYPQNCTIAVSAAASALTIALKDASGADPSSTSPCRIPFRSATGTTGSTSYVSVTAATSVVLANGNTMGVTSSTAFRIWIGALNNAGTAELWAYNASSATACFPINESAVQTTVASSGNVAGGAYASTTARASVAIRTLAYAEWNSTGITAGTWAGTGTPTNLATIQTFGPGIKRPCDVVKSVYFTSSTQTTTASTSYVNGITTLAYSPTSAANYLRHRVDGNVQVADAANEIYVQLQNTTASTVLTGDLGSYGAGSSLIVGFSSAQIERPNSTSSQTYYWKFKSLTGGSVYWPNQGVLYQIDEIMGALPEPANDNINPGIYGRVG